MNTQRVLSELERVAGLARGRSRASRSHATGTLSRGRGIHEQEDDPNTNLASFIERSHAKVIGHYQHILANADLTPAERADLEARLARQLNWSSETVLRSAA